MKVKSSFVFICLLLVLVASGIFLPGCQKAQSSSATVEQSSDGRRLADQGITEAVKAKLESLSNEESKKIEVETEAGTVVLSGIVSSQSTVEVAMNLAWSVEGVQDVQSEMIVVREEGK